MILVLASSLYEQDAQNILLLDILGASGKGYLFLNPLSLEDSSKMELVGDREGVHLLCGGSEIVADTIYMARNLRLDCILEIPRELAFTTLFRQKTDIFWEDICNAFAHKRWLPGTLSDIRRAESKVSLLQMAAMCGLNVPSVTKNSFKDLSLELGYRKVLGYPFSITYDRQEREEVAVTLQNRLSEDVSQEYIPWQWQSYLNAKSQVRCVVVGQKIHSYRLGSEQLRGKSLREATEDGEDLLWEICELPNDISNKLLLLMSSLRLNMCCPEFLVDGNGSYIFIDLNPCGDWFGFIDEKENQTVAQEIVDLL